MEWEPGQFIRLRATPTTGARRARREEVIFQTVRGDGHDGPGAPKTGELDYVRGIGADQFDALAKEPNIRVSEGYANGYTYISFNTRGNTKGYSGSTSALADPAFRDALGYAIDKRRSWTRS